MGNLSSQNPVTETQIPETEGVSMDEGIPLDMSYQMSIVSLSQGCQCVAVVQDRLKAEAKQNTKVITKREDTLEKELGEVEANSYLENLITVPNPKVLEIKDDASPIREMENSTMDVAVEATDPAVGGTA
nr:hypothetical protein CFP56_63270 [Quercus suber]